MDNYQAVYDAVRSRISNGDVGHAIESVARNSFDISHTVAILQQEFCIAASEMARPSAIYRPTISEDGTKWCALYGENLAEGVAGFGATPDEAMRDFDQAWWRQKTSAAIRAEQATGAQS